MESAQKAEKGDRQGKTGSENRPQAGYRLRGRLRRAADAGLILAGAVLLGIGMRAFIIPAQIAPGGASGLALMVNHLTGAPVGLITLLINIPLILLAWLYLSRRFAVTTAWVSAAFSLLLDGIITPLCPVYGGDRLLGSLYGGILAGAGIGLIFLTGASTGGTDIVGYLLQKKNPHISIGRALLLVDGCVLALSVFVFGNMDAALFGLIALFAQSKMVDSILYGGRAGAMAAIVTGQPEAISARIIRELARTATILPARGAYSGGERAVLLCAVRKSQFGRLSRIVHAEDPAAFMMAADTSEVLGEGFKEF